MIRRTDERILVLLFVVVVCFFILFPSRDCPNPPLSILPARYKEPRQGSISDYPYYAVW